MKIHFEYANKSDLELLLPQLFEILYANMSVIAPTSNTYEEDYEIWFSCVYPAMQKTQRQMILLYDEDNIIGYFQYYVNEEIWMMEEIQIRKRYHGTGVFSALYAWLVRQLPGNIKTVEAYAHKQNVKSQGILTHLGLKQIGENKSGNSYHYRGDYKNFLNRYL